MPTRNSVLLRQAVECLAVLLILKVTVAVVLGYVDYLPPNFDSDFLRGRQGYFWGAYHWAFYVHIATGPVSLILGLILVSDRFRKRYPQGHRWLGRVQAVIVLLCIMPSGLWMANYAATPAAVVGFRVLAISTGLGMALGWRAAVQRRFAIHRRWMWRTFLLLCSAVLLRLLGGLGTVFRIESPWFDPLASWTSWIVPLAVFELSQQRRVAALLRSIGPPHRSAIE